MDDHVFPIYPNSYNVLTMCKWNNHVKQTVVHAALNNFAPAQAYDLDTFSHCGLAYSWTNKTTAS